MIGGADIVISNPGRTRPEVFDAVVRTVQGYWPDVVIQDGTTGTRFDSYTDIAFAGLSEFFLYRDTNVFQNWEAQEANPAIANTMFHVLVEDDHVTLVVDDIASEFVVRVSKAIAATLAEKEVQH